MHGGFGGGLRKKDRQIMIATIHYCIVCFGRFVWRIKQMANTFKNKE
jgi:hypothetical protein